MVLEVSRNAGEEEHGKDRRVLPVEQADDLTAAVGRPRDEEVVRPEVGMADAETTQRGVLGDEGRRYAEVPLQQLDMV